MILGPSLFIFFIYLFPLTLFVCKYVHLHTHTHHSTHMEVIRVELRLLGLLAVPLTHCAISLAPGSFFQENTGLWGKHSLVFTQ